jgi:hypothetical protein
MSLDILETLAVAETALGKNAGGAKVHGCAS